LNYTRLFTRRVATETGPGKPDPVKIN